MKTIEQLLKFRFDPEHYVQKAHPVLPAEIEKRLELRLTVLQQKGGSAGKPEQPLQIEAVVQRFKKEVALGTDLQSQFTRREIRLLTWGLFFETSDMPSIVSKEKELKAALELIGANWKPHYWIGLLETYLSNWSRSKLDLLKPLGAFLALLVSEKKVGIENALWILPPAGPENLVKDFGRKGISLFEIPNRLLVSQRVQKTPYFTAAIVSYILQTPLTNTGLEETSAFIESNLITSSNGTRLNRVLVSTLILKAKETKNISDEMRERILAFATKNVGDPQDSKNWKPVSVEEETFSLPAIESARKVLLSWIRGVLVRGVFGIFYRKARGEFWNRYADDIDQVFIIGSANRIFRLQNTQRLSGLLRGNFRIEEKDILVMIMQVNGHVIIEVDQDGWAMLAYLKNNIEVPNIGKMTFDTLLKLRSRDNPLMVKRESNYISQYRTEGKLTHSDGDLVWQTVFDAWMRKIVLPFEASKPKKVV